MAWRHFNPIAKQTRKVIQLAWSDGYHKVCENVYRHSLILNPNILIIDISFYGIMRWYQNRRVTYKTIKFTGCVVCRCQYNFVINGFIYDERNNLVDIQPLGMRKIPNLSTNLYPFCNFLVIFLNRLIRINRKFFQISKYLHLVLFSHKVSQLKIITVVFKYKSLRAFTIRSIMRLRLLQKCVKLSQKEIFIILLDKILSLPYCIPIDIYVRSLSRYLNCYMLYKIP